jgi:TatD DNase family protein
MSKYSIVLADHHCHILKEYFEDPISEIKKLQEEGELEYICSMGIQLESDLENLEYKKKIDKKFFKIGIGLHPSDVIQFKGKALEEFEKVKQLILDNKSSLDFIGEIGIDFTYPDAEESRKEQIKIFREFCKLSKELKIPVSIHCRDAWDEIIQVIDEVAFNPELFNGYLHSFTGDFEQGMFFIENGFKLGLNGIVTFKKSEDLRDTIKEILEFYSDKDFNDLFGLETDTPYLTPEPIRSEKNHPKNIRLLKDYLENFLDNSGS